MSQEKSKIQCPGCGIEIDVNDILYHQVDEQLKKEYRDELKKEKEKFDSQSIALEKEKVALLEEKARQKEEIAQKVSDEVKEKVREKELALKKKIKAEAEEEQSSALNALREELNDKSSKIKELKSIFS